MTRDHILLYTELRLYVLFFKTVIYYGDLFKKKKTENITKATVYYHVQEMFYCHVHISCNIEHHLKKITSLLLFIISGDVAVHVCTKEDLRGYLLFFDVLKKSQPETLNS